MINSTMVITVTDTPFVGDLVVYNPNVTVGGFPFRSFFVRDVVNTGEVDSSDDDEPISITDLILRISESFTNDYSGIEGFTFTQDYIANTITLNHTERFFFDNYTSNANGLSFEITNTTPTQEEITEQALEQAQASGGLNDLRRYSFSLKEYVSKKTTGVTVITESITIDQTFAGKILLVDSSSEEVNLTLDSAYSLSNLILEVIGFDDTNGINVLTSDSEEIKAHTSDTATTKALTNGDKLKLISTGIYFQII